MRGLTVINYSYDDLVEVKSSDTAVDSYAMSATGPGQGYVSYLRAVGDNFGDDRVDYGILHKTFGAPPQTHTRYSPPKVTAIRKIKMWGNPDPQRISTSFVERSNLTIRMSNRRFTRLTNGYSKKFENHAHSIALHFMHYNYCRIHQTLRMTPAMAGGMSDHVWSLEDVIALIK